jgi:DNA-binding transcriptional regulator/RsmH inhibitor MraZ
MRDTLTKSKLDSQGRILLSENQIKVVGIKKNITLVGNNENIEIWSTEIYREYIEKEDDFDDVYFQSVESGLRVK